MSDFRFDHLFTLLRTGRRHEAREYIKAASGITWDEALQQYIAYGLDWNGQKIALGSYDDLMPAIIRYNDWVGYHYGDWARIDHD